MINERFGYTFMLTFLKNFNRSVKNSDPIRAGKLNSKLTAKYYPSKKIPVFFHQILNEIYFSRKNYTC